MLKVNEKQIFENMDNAEKNHLARLMIDCDINEADNSIPIYSYHISYCFIFAHIMYEQ